MANVKITDLTEDTTPATGDWIETVDISAGSSKKVTIANLFANGLTADIVRSSMLYYGLVRSRQGSTTGNASWATAGTNNTAVDAKDLFFQVGVVPSLAGEVTVTFPTAYTQVPLVFVSVTTATNQNTWARAKSLSTTGFTCQALVNATTSATAEDVAWLAIGQ